MPASADNPPAFSRIETSGALRALADCGQLRPALECDWGRIRAVQLESPPYELAEGHLLNHLVTLNLGPGTTSESNFSSQGWQAHHTPYHGVAVYPAFVPYSVREHGPRELLAVEMTPEFVAAVIEPASAPRELRPIIGAQDAFAKHVLLALAEEARAGAPSGILRAESLGTALVAHLVERELGPPPLQEAGLTSQKLRRVLDYIAAHLDAPLTLRTLAGLVDLDVFRFIRAFKLSTGLSPHRYVLEARIDRAKELLKNRDLPITDIALETGFATPSHFSVTFRRLVNVTPRAYRDSLP